MEFQNTVGGSWPQRLQKRLRVQARAFDLIGVNVKPWAGSHRSQSGTSQRKTSFSVLVAPWAVVAGGSTRPVAQAFR